VPIVLTFAGAGPVRLGMTLDETRKALSQQLTRGVAESADCYYFIDHNASVGLLVRHGRVVPGGHYLIVRSKGGHVLFIETDGRVVTRLRIGLIPAVYYPDGCL
jgi:hypothetical protein